MIETSLKVLKKIEEKGFQAYIVGGFVRDHILGIKSVDVDITTDATPKQIKDIFPDCFIPHELYGSITVVVNKTRFEINTFRKEFLYSKNRYPVEFEYINDLGVDLQRRDFTINTLCMNSSGEIIDLLNVMGDLKKGVIKTVGNSLEKFQEDALRILRAIRFATVLNFQLSPEIMDAILITKKYLRNLSYQRKKEELDKIFMSKNAKYGVEILLQLKMEEELEIYNLKNIKLSNDLVGVWASLDVSSKYPFTKSEKQLIGKIREVMSKDQTDPKVLYDYGPYVNYIASVNKGEDHTQVVDAYNNLPIKVRGDILISSKEIMSLVNRGPGKYLKDIYLELENRILQGKLSNDEEQIKEYIVANFRG